jgi:phospholipid/cholesterol/gamma-HCH transport system permease protein
MIASGDPALTDRQTRYTDAMDGLAAIGRFGIFAARAAARAITPPWESSEIARQILEVTRRSAAPVIATVAPLGMVMALQGHRLFDDFGAHHLLSSLVGAAVIRELSPVMASALVAAQGGSTFAAELGTMKIREELDATLVMAIDPLRVHVAPRLIAAVIATPVLHLFGSVAGVIGGWAVAVVLRGESSGLFWAGLWDLTTVADLIGGLLKTALFGAMIGLIASYQGFHADGGAAGVGRAVNDTVVVAITSFIVVNYFFTSAWMGLFG